MGCTFVTVGIFGAFGTTRICWLAGVPNSRGLTMKVVHSYSTESKKLEILEASNSFVIVSNYGRALSKSKGRAHRWMV